MFCLREVHNLTEEQIAIIVERLNNDDYLDEQIATAINYAMKQEGFVKNK
jgi:hypothetical protein